MKNKNINDEIKKIIQKDIDYKFREEEIMNNLPSEIAELDKDLRELIPFFLDEIDSCSKIIKTGIDVVPKVTDDLIEQKNGYVCFYQLLALLFEEVLDQDVGQLIEISPENLETLMSFDKNMRNPFKALHLVVEKIDSLILLLIKKYIVLKMTPLLVEVKNNINK